MQRPLPPFRAKPSRRAVAPKPQAGGFRETASAVPVKARRHPVKVARLNAAPALRVIGREATTAV